MVGHVQPGRTRGHERGGRVTVQHPAGGGRYVLIDRVVHELVPERDTIAVHVEELVVEGGLEAPGDLGRWAANHRGQGTDRHGIAEHRSDPEQVERRGRQALEATDHQVLQ